MSHPPRLAVWLLRRVLPADVRGASILGDLLEEFQSEVEAEVAAGRFWRHALSVAAGYLLTRLERTSSAATVRARDDLPVARRAPMGFGLLHEDVRYGIRGLLRTPTFTLIALATLALGIGASTAIFSLAYSVLLRPLPYASPARLVYVTETRGRNLFGVSWLNYLDWRARATSFEELAASLADAVNVTGDRPQRLNSRTSSWNFFRVLHVEPVLGRLFTEADGRANAAPVVVISFELWMRNYGGLPSVIGQTLPIEHLPHTIVGVLPAGFMYRAPADVYRPLEPLAAADFRGMSFRGNRTNLYLVGRLKPSVTVVQASSELDTITASLAREYPNTNAGSGASVVSLGDAVVARYRSTFVVLTGGVALLLLIACVNLANLLLARGSSRAHELSVRAALGGSRWRLVRQILVEQAVLVTAGGLLGAVTGGGLLMLLIALAPSDVPRLNEVRLNDALLFYTAAVSAVFALTFGFIPALKASSVRGQELLVRAGRTAQLSTTRARRGLMVAEVAVATILLAASGLMVRTMLGLTRTDPGFNPRDLLTMNVELMGAAWTTEKCVAVYDPMVQRLRALPGVTSAALTLSLPIEGSRWGSVYVVGDKPLPPPGQLPNASFTPVSNSYFETMQIPLVRGRLFDRRETATSQPVAVINETAARTMWPGEDPVGKRLKQGMAEDQHPWRTIVGVVADVKMEGIDRDTLPQVYLPIVHVMGDQPARAFVAVVRGEHADRMSAAVAAALREFDKEMPIYGVQTMDRIMANAVGRQRVSMVVLSVFGGVALLLAVIGLYGVITYGVNERTQEIGLRMALGATGSQILRLFLWQGLIATTIGIALGVVGALGLTSWLQTLLFGVTATDVPTFAVVAGVLLVVAVAACYFPARRAARVDPLIALRWE